MLDDDGMDMDAETYTITPKGLYLDEDDWIEKKWGTEQIIHNEDHCVKIMAIKPNCKVSYHWHSKKAETFILISGQLVVEVQLQDATKEIIYLTEQFQSITLMPNVPHTFYTPNEKSAIFIEASTHDDTDDSFRITSSTCPGDE
ncbi:MAG: hypothetical protein DRI24_03650 [Deltaproteobacteria bacterium]|nr:MAG: hypothetical protein DRI24_03650 [Deltaproteobacteria bacterium]